MLYSGKIVVVVAVLSLILLGILAYLIVMDRNISKMEKEIKEKSDKKEE